MRTQFVGSLLLLILLLGSSCASLRQRDETTQLNAIFAIPAHQKLSVYSRGTVLLKTLPKRARAALYQKGDTLYAEFIGSSLPPPDTRPNTLDQADSSAIIFVHYQPRLTQIEEKSPWFRYKSTAFDMDLTTMPLRYRPSTQGLPGQLNDYNLNVNVHVGFRQDYGRYRTTYFRRNQRSDILPFSIGFGGILGLAPIAVNAFSTQGLVANDYQALGISYGVSTTFSFSNFSAGLAVGYEKIADFNNRIWLYDNKAWIGFTVGVNLN
jgi:hypothetical protein